MHPVCTDRNGDVWAAVHDELGCAGHGSTHTVSERFKFAGVEVFLAQAGELHPCCAGAHYAVEQVIVALPESEEERIESLEESAVSLMPEGLLKDLKPQQLRDLFTFLQMPAPK